jgi:predicted transcriptional regulator
MAATFEHSARARDLHSRGWSCNAIAKELGVAPSTISRWAKREGLSFERGQVAAANAAKIVDGKARRLALADRGYKRAEALYARLEAPQFKTLVRGSEGREDQVLLDFVPTQNERDLAQAIATHLTSVAKLEAVDAGTGSDDAKSMLAQLGKALGIGQEAAE